MRHIVLPNFSGGVSLNPQASESTGLIVDTGPPSATVTSTAYTTNSLRPTLFAIAANGDVYIADSGTIHRTNLANMGSPSVLETSISGANIQGIVIAPNGDLYFTDFTNHVIYKRSGGQNTIFAGVQGQSGTQDGVGTAARFDLPSNLSINASGTILCIAARFSFRTIDIATAQVTTYNNSEFGDPGAGYRGTGSGAALIGGTGYDLRFLSYFDPNIVQQSASRLYAVNTATGYANQIGGTGLIGNQSSRRLGSFNLHRCENMVAISGHLFTIANNGILVRINPAIGTITPIAGLAGSTTVSADGVGTNARIQLSVKLAAFGNRLFFAERTGWKIKEVTNFL